MSNDLVKQMSMDESKIELLKNTICKGITDDELTLFLHVCQRTGLDPFVKQIYPVKRWSSALNKMAMVIQTGIDGYRLVADRTGKYVPGKESTFTYDKNGSLYSATSYVKKQTSDGIWHEVSVTALYSEYVQTDKNGNPNQFWKNLPHVMLAKCAESLAIRKCFPAELSGVYTNEEMNQSEEVQTVDVTPISSASTSATKMIAHITQDQAVELMDIISECSEDYQNKVNKFIKSQGLTSLYDLPVDAYPKLKMKAESERMLNKSALLTEQSQTETIEETDGIEE